MRAGLRGMRVGLGGVFVAEPGDFPVNNGGPHPAANAAGYNSAIPQAGRRATWEEAMAQFFAERLHTPDGSNQLAGKCGTVGFPKNSFQDTGELRVIQPPWIRIPASGASYTKDHIENSAPAQVLLPAVGFSVVVVQFTVPPRRNGVIQWIANEFIGGAAWQGTGSLVWQILADGVPIQNYESIVSSYGTSAAPGVRAPILISESQLIQLVLNNVAVVPAGQVLTGLLSGWFYPIEAEPAGGGWMM